MQTHASNDEALYVSIAREQCTPRELEMLEDMPNKLPWLTPQQLIEVGRQAVDCAREIKAMILAEWQEDEPNLIVLAKAVRAEYIWVTTCNQVADECERRRTGKAPRARHMH